MSPVSDVTENLNTKSQRARTLARNSHTRTSYFIVFLRVLRDIVVTFEVFVCGVSGISSAHSALALLNFLLLTRTDTRQPPLSAATIMTSSPQPSARSSFPAISPL